MKKVFAETENQGKLKLPLALENTSDEFAIGFLICIWLIDQVVRDFLGQWSRILKENRSGLCKKLLRLHGYKFVQ